MNNNVKHIVSFSFKPYYKWNTFNTNKTNVLADIADTSFKPYYKWNTFNTLFLLFKISCNCSFKPYYKWNTFNTSHKFPLTSMSNSVLNLIINGIPSIP